MKYDPKSLEWPEMSIGCSEYRDADALIDLTPLQDMERQVIITCLSYPGKVDEIIPIVTTLRLYRDALKMNVYGDGQVELFDTGPYGDLEEEKDAILASIHTNIQYCVLRIVSAIREYRMLLDSYISKSSGGWVYAPDLADERRLIEMCGEEDES